MIVIRAWFNPAIAPRFEVVDRADLWHERRAALRAIWPLLVLILAIVGGLYAGVVTPTEAGAAGTALALVIGFVQGGLSLRGILGSLREATATTALIFFIGMGAVMYTQFLVFARIGPCSRS